MSRNRQRGRYDFDLSLSWSTEALRDDMVVAGFWEVRTAQGWHQLCMKDNVPSCQSASLIPGGKTPPGHPAGGGVVRSSFMSDDQVTAVRFGFSLLRGAWATTNANEFGRPTSRNRPPAAADSLEQGYSSKSFSLPSMFRYLTCYFTGENAGQCSS